MPTRKTRIMYGCGLSSKQAVDLLEHLRSSDLIEKNEEPPIYQTTKKGYEFLCHFDRLSQLLQTGKAETPKLRSELVEVKSV